MNGPVGIFERSAPMAAEIMRGRADVFTGIFHGANGFMNPVMALVRLRIG
jgi:hypothetical protein